MTKDEQWLLDEKYGGIESEQFDADKERLAFGEPLAYVIGWQPFLGLKIFLDSKPLIPRAETEWWTEKLLRTMSEWSGPAKRGDPRTFAKSAEQFRFAQIYSEDFPKDANELRFLDLCAGSGAIGCAVLSRIPTAQVYFGEVDSAHEQTIVKNIHENNLDESRAHVCIGDLFEPFKEMRFDVIAINPPYIPKNRELDKSVSAYEPALALFSGDDGLDLIRKIALELPKHLAPNGIAYIECDSAAAAAAAALFSSNGLTVTIRTDQYDKSRVLVVSYK